MDCPPGSFRNPLTSRCVKVTGRKARELYEGRYVDYGAMVTGYGVPVYRAPGQAVTRRRDRSREPGHIDIVGAFAGRRRRSSSGETRRHRPFYAPAPVPVYQQARYIPQPPLQPTKPPAYPFAAQQPKREAQPPVDVRTQPCPSTRQVRNPITGRCVVIGGRAYKDAGLAPPVPVPTPAPGPGPAPSVLKALTRPVAARRSSSEGRPDLPLHASAVAPLSDRSTILGWAAGNCKEQRDAITGTPFRNMDAANLQQLVRLHNRACTLAVPLHTKVAAQHRDGTPATLPDDPTTQMVLADFVALREAMRRTNPAYKLPGRRHQPPPPNWRLYVARDARSGPDYMSVMYVDTKKARATQTGIEYPPESVRVDMGFIPSKQVTGALCDPSLIVETLQRLAEANRLLDPVAGGWKPVAGFPFTKSYWTRDTKDRLSNLCRELIRALTTPL